jgi:beta-galactosidase
MTIPSLSSTTLALAIAAVLSANGGLTATLNAQLLPAPGRERLPMDSDWRFAFGHPSDTRKDFNHATEYFSYLAKTGYGDGPAAADFDDRAWRTLDLPHDWAVEMPFDGRGSHSHGYKAVGRNFPDTSVGWYRKSFFIPASDLGRRIRIEFDGVYRDARVWINGHYLGNEPSGYAGFGFNLTEFLNYGGNNVLAVRADATLEEGWFYEGAGIYRHVWLVKTAPVHALPDGTFVTAEITNHTAAVTTRTAVINESTNAALFDLEQTLVDPTGRTVSSALRQARLEPWDTTELVCPLQVHQPALWSLEAPVLYTLSTVIRSGGAVVDRFQTPFGIRTLRFDPDQGFLLNGKRVELKGSNNHQDHAGVGAAIPDALQDFRIRRLKAMGGNAYRCSHNPPTPELLDACDRLGMLVIDENRLMGTSEDQLQYLKRLIRRDRNHPSVILWSLGNEEWGIEGNEKGERITATMQAIAAQLDPTRPATVASSGGWDYGSSLPIAVMGYNYIVHGNIDEHHRKLPWQAGVGTEETTTQGTRGVYVDDRPRAHLAPVENGSSGGNAEVGWKYYAARPFLAGLFYWTGFDYRGESTPFGYPAISSQFGILDTCGFPKDIFYYLKAWWTDAPVLHLFPHWNWPGKEGQELTVGCYGNADEVELSLNGRSLGRKTMEKNGHLQWTVAYEPGTLLARGFKDGNEMVTARVETTGEPAAIQLTPDRSRISADARDVAVITAQVNDAQGRLVPTASHPITFALQGPGKIIGVGNGDPSSHEPDRFVDQVSSIPIQNWRRQEVTGMSHPPEVALDFDDSGWPAAFGERREGNREDRNAGAASRTNVYRGVFLLPPDARTRQLALLLHSLGGQQAVFVNGKPLTQPLRRDDVGFTFNLDPDILRTTNVVAIIATSLPGTRGTRARIGRDGPGLIRVTIPAGNWNRSAFNGLAQVIVQSTGQPGQITLTATAPALASAVLTVQSQPVH